MTSELERLAYDLSSHALAQQERFFNDLRSQTGTVLAASAVVASFLGAKATDKPRASEIMFISEAEMMGYSPGPILRFIDWLLGRLAELRRPKNPQQRDD